MLLPHTLLRQAPPYEINTVLVCLIWCNILFIRALEHAPPRQNTAILMISKDAQSRTCTHNYRKALCRITRMRTTKNSNECSIRVTTSSPILSWVFITITLRGTPLAVRSAWFNNALFVNRT